MNYKENIEELEKKKGLYKLETINVNELKKHIDKAKLFIQEIANITNKDEGLFR